jgi:hypothetical protein
MVALIIAMPDVSSVVLALSLVIVAVAGAIPTRSARRYLTRDGRALAQRLKKYEAK